MNLEEARSRAEATLATLQEEAGRTLEFYEGRLGVETVRETAWCWLFRYNTPDYMESGSHLDQIMAGPIVVPKNGGEPWTMGTYASEDEQLLDYQERNGPYAERDML
jgi:hypothetical protein